MHYSQVDQVGKPHVNLGQNHYLLIDIEKARKMSNNPHVVLNVKFKHTQAGPL